MRLDVTDTGTTSGLSEQVAEEIRALLGRRRMSQAALARALKVSPMWVNYRLTGTQPIDLNDLDRIAAVLGVDIIDLLPREGKLIAVGGTTRTPARESKPWNLGLPDRPRPIGPPSRNTAGPSTRRTGRVRAALAAA